MHPATLPVVLITVVVTACVLWLLIDAIVAKRGKRWIATMAGGSIFGWGVEWTNTHDVPLIGSSTHIYCYPELPINIFGVPFWIALGWGGIIYAATWTAQRLRLSPWARPAAAAFLAVSIDFSLDPVARLMGFWRWRYYPVSFCSIPYDNYIAWYLVVAIYAGTAAWILRKTKDSWCTPQANAGSPAATTVAPKKAALYEWGLPLACALVATLFLVVFKKAFSALGSLSSSTSCDYGTPAGTIFIFATLIGGLVTLVFARKPIADTDPPVNWPVMIVPAVIHVTCYVLFLVFAPWKDEPLLLASIPIQLMAGIFVFGTPWRRQLS